MLNLNAKELKELRDKLAIWHIADFKKADINIESNSQLQQWRNVQATDVELITRINSGDTEGIGMTIEEAEKSFAQAARMIEAITSKATKLREEQLAAEKVVYEMLDKAGIKDAITAYASNIYSDEARKAMLKALVALFSQNDLKGVTSKDVEQFMPACSACIKKLGAKAACKNNSHNGVEKGNKLYDTFLGCLVEEPTLKAMLPVHKWEHVIEKKTKKNNK